MSDALEGAALIDAVRDLPAGNTGIEVEEAERRYISKHIQPWVERDHVDWKLNERVRVFTVHGHGDNKWIAWQVQSGIACKGCYGSGDLRSHKGTRTECPDCWGGGIDYESGETRTLKTDYDGDPL